MHGRGVGRAARALAQVGTGGGKSTKQQAGEVDRTGSSRSNSRSALLEPLGGRRVHTVVSDTKIDANGNVEDPGHIQYQTSEAERERDPELARAIGHSRLAGPNAPRPKRFKVSGTLADGKPFRVGALRGAAIVSGDDKLIAPEQVSRMIDHGEMTDAQIARMKEVQRQPIFAQYETSGIEKSNCVHAHAQVAGRVFDWNVQPEAHARPQDLAERMAHFKTTDTTAEASPAASTTPASEPEPPDLDGSQPR